MRSGSTGGRFGKVLVGHAEQLRNIDRNAWQGGIRIIQDVGVVGKHVIVKRCVGSRSDNVRNVDVEDMVEIQVGVFGTDS